MVFSMADRNRWFTVLKNGWIFHGKLLNNQRVYIGRYRRMVDGWKFHHFHLPAVSKLKKQSHNFLRWA